MSGKPNYYEYIVKGSIYCDFIVYQVNCVFIVQSANDCIIQHLSAQMIVNFILILHSHINKSNIDCILISITFKLIIDKQFAIISVYQLINL